MTILVLGGTGKTGGSLTKLLHEAGISFIVASRSGKAEPYKAVTFDWFNPSTFENPFNADSNIDKVYLVVPVAYYDIAPIVNPFIDLAISKGVKRIVLLTTLQTEPGVEPTFGAVHQYLASKDIEYAVLRPSWFMQNFAYNFYQSIRENNEVFSATGDGKIPWISTEDIAQAAFDTLTTPESIRKDLLIVGPELLTYDEAAKLLSSVLGREIKHKRHTSDEQVKAFSQFLSPEFSKLLADMEVAVSQGFEESCLKEPPSRLYVGKHKLEDYFKANRDLCGKYIKPANHYRETFTSHTMTTLITGGTGKTGSILARLLHAAGKPFLIASRTGKAPELFKAVKFDWFDVTTFENPFKLSADIDRVYLIIPLVLDPLPVMKPFIDLAVSKGVKRFIFMSTSSTNAGDELHGKVHQYLLDIGVGYGVLRPTGFMENFGQHPWFVRTIKESSELVSAYQDGRIPYVACEDIAQAAFEMLTAEESPNEDIYVVGPTLYSNDEALALLSSVLGREIKHRRNTVAEQEEFYKTKFAFPPELAKVLSQRDKQIADGFQESLVNEPEDKKFIGKKTLLEYFQKNSELWTK